MPIYQNTSVTNNNLVYGNYKIETSASTAGTYVNMGAGLVTRFEHVVNKYTSQSGNAPDPAPGIARETFEVDFELIEYDSSVLSAIQCGAISSTTTTSVQTMWGGGKQALTPRAYKLTNTRYISGVTVQTILYLLSGTMTGGINFAPKNDNDDDPIQIFSGTIEAKPIATATRGQQLFRITHDVPA